MDDNGHLMTQFTIADLTAGKATLTFVSKATGSRYTFTVTAAKKTPGLWFVNLLPFGAASKVGRAYLGVLRQHGETYTYNATAKSEQPIGAPCQKAIQWLLAATIHGTVTEAAEVWHSGHCVRCGRKLVVPESLISGWGPECQKHMEVHHETPTD